MIDFSRTLADMCRWLWAKAVDAGRSGLEA
jgi:hypothetical protein